jgi:hypothetical protein
MERGLYPEKTDAPRDLKRKLMKRENAVTILHQYKYNAEFFNYIVYTLRYLKDDLKLKPILMFDDIDRLKNIEDARDIINYSSSLARKLGIVPIIVSSREETLALLADMDDQGIEKIPIMPPSFDEVLKRRVKNFNNKYYADKTQLANNKLTIMEVKEFVNFIADSILEDNNLLNLITFHYDLDILLDMVKCIITSPFIDYPYIMNLKKSNKKLRWHVILDSLMRYKYSNFYEENSFILNVYDNEMINPTPHNALIRVRILQAIRSQMRRPNEPIKVGDIYAIMNYIGYEKIEVIRALSALSKQRLIVTGKHYNAFHENIPEITPTHAVPYYLKNLILNYRYIQNILPVTNIPFDIPIRFAFQESSLRSGDLKEMDTYISKFIDFIKECEEIERTGVKDKSIFDNITRNKSLNHSLRDSFNQERSSMIGSGL